jgi:hypothetical protein
MSEAAVPNLEATGLAMKTNYERNVRIFLEEFIRWGWLGSYWILALAVLTLGQAAAETAGSGSVVIIRTPHGGEPAEATLGSDGRIHLLYGSNAEGIPYYVNSSDSGKSFNSPVPVVDTSSRRPGLVFSGEAMAVGKSGSVYVATSTNNWKMKFPGVVDGLVFTSLAVGSGTFARLRSLNGQPSEGFSLAADESGNIVATWLADKLYVNFSRDGGRTFTPNAEINPSYDPCNCCTTRAVYGTDGSLAVLYREEKNNQRDMYLVILKKDGQQSRTRISSTLWEVNGCPMTYFGLSATKNGYVAAWPTRGEIYFARMDRNGRVLSPGEVKTSGHSGMRTGLIALEAPDGRSLIAWNHQGQLSWQQYSPEGQPEGSPRSVPTTGNGVAGVVSRSGKFILFQ